MTIWNILQQNYSTATNVDSRDTLSYQADSFINCRCGIFYFQYPHSEKPGSFFGLRSGFRCRLSTIGRYFVASG
jgi:hypothetical protein